jgi:hypothetical protein
MKIIKWYEPTFKPIIQLIAKEAKESKWGNSEGMRVIAKHKFGLKISKASGDWHRIVVLDEQKYAWMMLKL